MIECPRRNVLQRIVEYRRERVVRSAGPHSIKILVRSAAEQQGSGVSHALRYGPAHRSVAIRRRPAAVLEFVAAVFARATGALHHAVEREVKECDDLGHWRSSGSMFMD